MKRIVITPFRISETNKDILSRLDELLGKKVLKNSWNLCVADTPDHRKFFGLVKVSRRATQVSGGGKGG
jgi:hypothetical protein